MKKLKKIIEYGIYLAILFLPIQTRYIFQFGGARGGFLEYGTISLYAFDIFIFILFSLWLVYFFKKKEEQETKIDFFWYLIAVLGLVIFASIFWSFDKLNAIYYYSLFLEGIALLVLVVYAEYRKKFFYLFLSISLFIQGLVAGLQFFLQDSLSLKWLGMARHFPGDLGISVIETLSTEGLRERWLRSYGTFDHPNILAAWLAFGLLSLLSFFIYEKFYKEKGLKFDFYFVSFCLGVLGLVFSFSRASWLALVCSVVLMLFVFVITKNLKAQLRILSLVLVTGVLFFAPFFAYNNLFVARINSEGRLEEKSQNERAEYLQEGRDTIKENWFKGVGVGSYVLKEVNARPEDYFWQFQPVHNVFFLVWAEIGIFGLLAFLALFVWILIESIEKKQIFNLAIIVLLSVMFVFDHFWWSLHFGILFFWFIMGIMIKNLKNK